MNISASELYLNMTELRCRLKLLHFQTTNYNIHKIVDKFLTDFDNLFDTFWEVYQSDKFRIKLSYSKQATTIHLTNTRTLKDLTPILTIVITQLNRIANNSKSSKGVKVSAENLLESIDQFAYLLTFS